jgi:hypothetical protein
MPVEKSQALVIVRGMAGAAVGAVLGWFAFDWLFDQGLYGLALPGALVGLVCGVASGGTSLVNAIACTVVAIGLALVIEWKHFAFAVDGSFAYFVTHLHQLRGVTWLMMILGAVFAFWFGRGRTRASAPRRVD